MAYKVFTNGSPLPASDLNTYLMNQSVISFANATARDATLTSPTEGMIVYLESDDSLYLYTGSAWEIQNPITTQGDLIIGASSGVPSRLGIGTNGQVLTSNGTTASWQAAPAGGSLEVIVSGSLTSSVSFTSIPQTFKHLELELNNFAFTVDNVFGIRFNNDSSSNYAYRTTDIGGTATSGTGTDLRIIRTSLDTAEFGRSVIKIYDYTNTSGNVPVIATTAGQDPSSVLFNNFCFGAYASSAAITRIDLVLATFASGTYVLYGVK